MVHGISLMAMWQCGECGDDNHNHGNDNNGKDIHEHVMPFTVINV